MRLTLPLFVTPLLRGRNRRKEKTMAGKNVATQVEELLLPTVEGLGYQLWDVEFVKMGAEWHLVVTIDKPEGIQIEDCELVHRAIDPVLDEKDPIEISYRLDVSSPGIERDLRRESHFLASLGERVRVRLFTAVDGKKQLDGTLVAYEGGAITLSVGEEEVTLPKGAYAKVTTVYFD